MHLNMEVSCSRKDWQSLSMLRCPVADRSLLTSGLSRLVRMAKMRLISSSSHSSAYNGRPPSCCHPSALGQAKGKAILMVLVMRLYSTSVRPEWLRLTKMQSAS